MASRLDYTIARVLHWVAGVIIAFNLLSAWKIADFPLGQKEIIIMIHSGIGVVILMFMLFRWWWRRSRGLYTPRGWHKRPSMLLQWIFYPLLVLQVFLGVAHAAYADYPVFAFGFIELSALAGDDEAMRILTLQAHAWMGGTLIALILIHGAERYRKIFTE